MKTKDEQSNEVSIKKEAGAIANVNIEQFADAGFDNVDSKSLALPFLKVLGQLSPQVTQGDSQFNPEAKLPEVTMVKIDSKMVITLRRPLLTM